jgi:hypothetical protein
MQKMIRITRATPLIVKTVIAATPIPADVSVDLI